MCLAWTLGSVPDAGAVCSVSVLRRSQGMEWSTIGRPWKQHFFTCQHPVGANLECSPVHSLQNSEEGLYPGRVQLLVRLLRFQDTPEEPARPWAGAQVGCRAPLPFPMPLTSICCAPVQPGQYSCPGSTTRDTQCWCPNPWELQFPF